MHHARNAQQKLKRIVQRNAKSCTNYQCATMQWSVFCITWCGLKQRWQYWKEQVSDEGVASKSVMLYVMFLWSSIFISFSWLQICFYDISYLTKSMSTIGLYFACELIVVIRIHHLPFPYTISFAFIPLTRSTLHDCMA